MPSPASALWCRCGGRATPARLCKLAAARDSAKGREIARLDRPDTGNANNMEFSVRGGTVFAEFSEVTRVYTTNPFSYRDEGWQPGKSYPNTTELAGFMKVNDTPAEAAEQIRAPEIPSSLGSKEPDPLRFVFAGSGCIIATAIAC